MRCDYRVFSQCSGIEKTTRGLRICDSWLVALLVLSGCDIFIDDPRAVCDDGKEIPAYKLCDCEIDCAGGEDEEACGDSRTTSYVQFMDSCDDDSINNIRIYDIDCPREIYPTTSAYWLTGAYGVNDGASFECITGHTLCLSVVNDSLDLYWCLGEDVEMLGKDISEVNINHYNTGCCLPCGNRDENGFLFDIPLVCNDYV